MNDAEIREAVGRLQSIQIARYRSGQKATPVIINDGSDKALQTLITLAQSYLSIEGMPEERDEERGIGEESGMEYRNDKNISFNESLHLCKLAMLKKCEGLEKVIGEIRIDEGGVSASGEMTDKDIKAIALAVRNHLLGGRK